MFFVEKLKIQKNIKSFRFWQHGRVDVQRNPYQCRDKRGV